MDIQIKTMLKRIALLPLFCFFVLACADNPLVTPVPPTPMPTAVPTEPPTPTPLPSPEPTARNFLSAWEKGQYEAMYALVSSQTRATTSQEAFVKRYRDIATEGTFTSIKAQIKDLDVALNKAMVNFSVTIDSALAGQFVRLNSMPMTFEAGAWRIDWSPTVIFAELAPGNLVHMLTHVTSRGEIYDRNNQKLAAQDPLITVGVVPGQIEDQGKLLSTLSTILEMDARAIRDKYASARPDWFIPIKDILPERSQKFADELSALKGVSLRDKERRIYPFSTLAEHLVGYVGPINAEELLKLAPQGYSPDDTLGKSGVEKWGEKYLRGELGGTLLIIAPSGEIVTTLSAKGPQPGRNIYTTLDSDLQAFLEKELEGKVGAAVVLDVRTGEILAMASSPGYDLNTLTQGTAAQIQALLNNPQRPLINRATQGLYPTGSLFKIVTISGGLERGGLKENSLFNCTGVWTGLGPQYAKTDWRKEGHGNITLFNGLIQSCNIVFYDVGLALDKLDRGILPSFARAYGFGAATNAPGLADEASGNVPDPTKQVVFVGDMVNVAIGQGDFLATPLQVANMLAAVGNGGTLYRPRLIAKISGPKDERRQDFTSELMGKLPVSPANLSIIQRALKAVTSTAPGTAARAFAGSKLTVAGKTGTAQSPPGEAHAWFAAYAPADNAKIAVVVMIEHGGEGSSTAAPIARRIFDKYFAVPR